MGNKSNVVMYDESWKSVGNELEISWKINCSSSMGNKSNDVRHHETSWKSYDILEISWKSAGNQLEISWK